jgi:uncharacterized protein YbaP (TraB family)
LFGAEVASVRRLLQVEFGCANGPNGADSRFPEKMHVCLSGVVHMRAWMLGIVALGLSCSVAAQRTDSPPPPPVAAPASTGKPAETKTPEAPKRKAFLWAVKSPTATVHLFGTIHVGKRDFYPLSNEVETALKDAAKLVVEADISDASNLGDLPALMTFMPPENLEKNIPPALFARLQVQLMRLKIPPQAVNAMRPFMVAGLLAVTEYSRIGYDASQGVDAYLIKNAKAAMKPVLELESVKGQVSLLAAMPKDVQEAFLENTIAGLERGQSSDQVIGVINAWQSGDMKLMQEVADQANKGMRKLDALDDILIHNRNREMLKKIEGFLAGNEKHFVAVGSLHLTGPRGLIALLKEKGYELTQL